MDTESRVGLVARGASEVLVKEELLALLDREEHPHAYIGYEPSGPFTVGQVVTLRKILDLEEAGFRVTVFLADWHALINDKLGGSLERISEAGHEMERVIRALGAGDGVRFRWASDLVGTSGYWARVIRVAKAMSLSRVRRAMTVMGRGEDEADLDAAKLFYPPMQVADIFELEVDLAYGGMDQRRAHVLAREVAARHGWKVPIALHTPLISSLKGGGRMDAGGHAGLMEKKMSKSDTGSAIYVTDASESLTARLREAYCPAREVEGNPVVELARHVVLPWDGRVRIARPEKYGGDLELSTEEDLLREWTGGKIHPLDLKGAVGTALARLLAPARKDRPPG